MKLLLFVTVVVFVMEASGETPVQKCPKGRTPAEYKQSIQIGNCTSHPCRLKAKTTIAAEYRFTTDRQIRKLRNSVSAKIAGIPFPFFGVDNTDACSQLYESDGQTKASCPLQPGVEYVYKNQFPILEYYPRVKLVVHWGLTGDDDQDALCFEVPARITS